MNDILTIYYQYLKYIKKT